MIGYNEIIIRLFAAAVLGALIGYEREYYHKAAGLRTHMLVSVGSALITLVSIYAFESGDPTRVASSIITGIGFLGAGAIIVGKGNVRGLTTAATLWMVAGLGLAVGAGFYVGAMASSALVILILELNRFMKIK